MKQPEDVVSCRGLRERSSLRQKGIEKREQNAKNKECITGLKKSLLLNAQGEEKKRDEGNKNVSPSRNDKVASATTLQISVLYTKKKRNNAKIKRGVRFRRCTCNQGLEKGCRVRGRHQLEGVRLKRPGFGRSHMSTEKKKGGREKQLTPLGDRSRSSE